MIFRIPHYGRIAFRHTVTTATGGQIPLYARPKHKRYPKTTEISPHDVRYVIEYRQVTCTGMLELRGGFGGDNGMIKWKVGPNLRYFGPMAPCQYTGETRCSHAWLKQPQEGRWWFDPSTRVLLDGRIAFRHTLTTATGGQIPLCAWPKPKRYPITPAISPHDVRYVIQYRQVTCTGMLELRGGFGWDNGMNKWKVGPNLRYFGPMAPC